MKGGYFNFIWEFISFNLLCVGVLLYPLIWVVGEFSWYQPFFYLIYLYLTIYNVFVLRKVSKPLFVDFGDITRFTPTFIPDEVEDEFNIYSVM